MAKTSRKSNETDAHRRLKTLAMAWAREQGWVIAAPEVRVPRSGYRADVVAMGRGAEARCAIFECKQARADFLKDAHDDAAVRTELAALLQRRERLEKLLGEHRPDLRRSETLFAEYDAWDFEALSHKGYHDLLSQIVTVQARVLKGTKFAKMFRYRCADFLYLVVEEDIYAPAEIPAGWGMLVRRADELELRRKPTTLRAEPGQRVALLESIALKATKALAAASI